MTNIGELFQILNSIIESYVDHPTHPHEYEVPEIIIRLHQLAESWSTRYPTKESH